MDVAQKEKRSALNDCWLPICEPNREDVDMKRIRFIILTAVLVLLVLTAKVTYEDISVGKSINVLAQNINSGYETTAKQDLLALMMAYPQHIKGLEMDESQKIYVVMQSDSKIIYDDMRSKSYDEKLADADLQDMMEMIYPLNPIRLLSQDCFDPGRIRVYAFLNEVYGCNKSEVEANLESVSIGSRICPFNGQNGASAALEKAFKDLAQVMKDHPEIYNFAYPTNGTFNYRVIAGTNQLSPHAYAIAIDLKSDPCDYWRWASKEQGQSRLDIYPDELVEAFENNGFIWGGKWAHFDFLHYEYRPELILKAKYSVDPNELTDSWYGGFPDTEQVRGYIEMIEDVYSE